MLGDAGELIVGGYLDHGCAPLSVGDLVHVHNVPVAAVFTGAHHKPPAIGGTAAAVSVDQRAGRSAIDQFAGRGCRSSQFRYSVGAMTAPSAAMRALPGTAANMPAPASVMTVRWSPWAASVIRPSSSSGKTSGPAMLRTPRSGLP